MKRNLKLFFGCASLIMATGASLAQAAIISSLNTTWPTSPDVQTLDPLPLTPANRGISGTRVNRQSFSVASDVTVGSIFLASNNYNNQAFNISIVETTAVNASPLVDGAVVAGPITVAAAGSLEAGNRIIKIDLAPSEIFTLPAKTGTEGYIMLVQLTDTSTPVAFNWVHSNNGSDVYTGGRSRRDDGNQTNTRDFGLALVAVVPEPGSAMLLFSGFAGLATIRRRK
jgi:hypothetical protein